MLQIKARSLRRCSYASFNTPLGLPRGFLFRDYSVYDVNYNGSVNRTSIKKTNHQIMEKALPGFDVEAGGSLPAHDQLSGFLAFYYFDAKGVQSVAGMRLRANYEVTDWLSFDVESNKDDVRGFTSYLGLNLSWDFDNSTNNTLTLLVLNL